MKFVGCVILSRGVFPILCLVASVNSATAGQDVVRVDSPRFKIPVQVGTAQQGKIKELQLFVSANQGKTWQQAASLSPDGNAFRFEAPGRGLYWFNVRVVNSDGTPEPADM